MLIGGVDTASFFFASVVGAEIAVGAILSPDAFAETIGGAIVLGRALVTIVTQRPFILWEDTTITGFSVPPQSLALAKLDFRVVLGVARLERAVRQVYGGEFGGDVRGCLRKSLFQLLSVWNVWKSGICDHGQRGFWGRGASHQ